MMLEECKKDREEGRAEKTESLCFGAAMHSIGVFQQLSARCCNNCNNNCLPVAVTDVTTIVCVF